MAIKNLLVVVDHSEQSAARVDAAILLAVTHDAHLTGLFVAALPVLPSYVAGELGEGIIAIQRRKAQEHAEKLAAIFSPGGGTGGHRRKGGMAGAAGQPHGSDRHRHTLCRPRHRRSGRS